MVALHSAGLTPWRSTTQAARTFCGRLQRAGGWAQLSRARQLEATRKAPTFAAWLMVTGQLTITADFLSRADLRLGIAARHYCPEAHTWFVALAEQLGLRPADTMLQWSTLAKVTALTRTPPGTAYAPASSTGPVWPSSTRSSRAGRRGPAGTWPPSSTDSSSRCSTPDTSIPMLGTRTQAPISVRGWAVVAPGITEVARRYVDQVALSLRPSTVAHIEHALREFSTWLADHHPQVATCADLERHHIEHFKTWLATKHGLRTGKPLNRISIKNRLINLHCFFDRITEWGYPHPPQRPLVFAGDLPIVDKPLPRFLDDAAAAKLLRTSRVDADPLARLIVELLARTGMRSSELRALTVDAVVQIGSAYWLRIPIGKLHNDRYIPLHPQLKDLLDDWIAHHRPAGLRSDRLLLERHRPASPPGASPTRCAASAPKRASATSPRTSSAIPWPPKPSTVG